MTLSPVSSQLKLFDGMPQDRGAFTTFCSRLRVKGGLRWADRFGEALRRWSSTSVKRPIKTISLFSGAGGLDIAFHDAGFAIHTMVEIEERFVATLKANCGPGGLFSGADPQCCDIRSFNPSSEMKADFVIGGPPCQTFSAAGRRAAGVQGMSDRRGTLFEEYVRLLRQLKPHGFLFENVYGITGAEQGKSWEIIRSSFEDAGYQISFRILDAADYGVPQHRERMFIVGTRSGRYKFPRPTHGPDSPDQRSHVRADQAIEGSEVFPEEASAEVGGRFGALLKEIPPGLNYSYFTEQMGHPKPIFAWRSKFSDFLYKADPATPVRTLKAQGGQYTGPFHWEDRPFSVAELKRLQTIPDKYQIVGGRQVAIHQIGNSVPPQIGRILALTILNQLFGVKLPVELPLLEENEPLGFRKRKRHLTAIYKAKADEATRVLSTMERPIASKTRGRKYSATLTPGFDWLKTSDSPGAIRVSCFFGKDQWRIETEPPAVSVKEKGFSIQIGPSPGNPWAIRAESVLLRGNCLSRDAFTGAWKAFERELIHHSIKADLVQLCGYYQYKPSIVCKMSIEGAGVEWRWRALARVVAGDGVGSILPSAILSAALGIDSKRMLAFALWLRGLGFEVRNHRTNPQIPNNAFLIPYGFPTLTPMSVQLRKSLNGGAIDSAR